MYYYALILSHSPSDITLLYKSKGQKDHMNTFQSALKSVVLSVLDWLVRHNLLYRNITLEPIQEIQETLHLGKITRYTVIKLRSKFIDY